MSDEILACPLQTDQDADAFYRLNRLWISEHFVVTPEDEKVLGQPRESIVAEGGEVLVATTPDGTVVGVVAVLAAGSGVYELAKMTVDESTRGKRLGARLIQAAIGWAREHGAHLLFLGTNTKLAAAVHLYEAAGFQRSNLEDLGLENYYARADLLMRIDLSPA